MGEKAPEEPEVGRDPREPELPERPAELAGRRREGLRTRFRFSVTPHDDLGDQRIEARIRDVSRVSARIDAHPGTARRLEDLDDPAGRTHRAVRLQGFEVHPRLHRVAAARDAVPFLGERGAGRELDLEADEVDPHELLRHRMLDLDPRVGLDEVPGAGFVHQELERAEVREPGRLREGEGVRDDAIAKRGVQVRGGRRLDDLLTPPLQAALAFAEVDHPAGPVARHLDLDMPRPRDEAFDVEVVPAEGPPGLLAATRPLALERRGAPHGGHSAPPSPSRRLDHHPGPARPEGGQKLARRLQPSLAPGSRQHGRPASFRERPRPDLVAEEVEGLRTRADEGDAAFRAAPREPRVLAQEAVSGMDGVALRALRRPENGFLSEIGGGPPSGQGFHLVRPKGMEGPRIVLGAHRDRGDAKLRRAPRDADRDLAPVGDEDAPEPHLPPSSVHHTPPPIIGAPAERKQPPPPRHRTAAAFHAAERVRAGEG